jgi:hypothetical protein
LRNELVEELISEPTDESRAELDARVKREQKERDSKGSSKVAYFLVL